MHIKTWNITRLQYRQKIHTLKKITEANTLWYNLAECLNNESINLQKTIKTTSLYKTIFKTISVCNIYNFGFTTINRTQFITSKLWPVIIVVETFFLSINKNTSYFTYEILYTTIWRFIWCINLILISRLLFKTYYCTYL